MPNPNLDTNYQLMITIRNLAGVYHNSAVEKIDHVFFSGQKTAIKPELITLLKSRPCREAFTDQTWVNILTGMGYAQEQINDFTQIVLQPGQATLAEQLTAYATRFPEHSMYQAMDTILKDFSHEPTFAIIAQNFQTSEDEVRGLFAVAYHYLDTMSPLETDLNLLNDFYEQHFDGFRDHTVFTEVAKILGQFDRDCETLSTEIADSAEQYIRYRTQQLCQYAQLDTSRPDVATNLQAFKTQLSAEIAYLRQDKNLSDPSIANPLLSATVQPEIMWLEEIITTLSMSRHANKRQKGASIRAAYNAIPFEQRGQIVYNMQKSDCISTSPVGKLKEALDLSTSNYPILDMLIGRNKLEHLSKDFKERYRGRRNSDNSTSSEETNSNPGSRPGSPN